jgi:hypothetical protein
VLRPPPTPTILHILHQTSYLQAPDPLDSSPDARLALASAHELFWRGSLRTDDRACGVRTRLNGVRSDARREGLTLT